MGEIFQNIGGFLKETGVAGLFTDGGWKLFVMYGIVIVLFYLAIVKKFEPMLLLPIAFGMLLTNLPFAELYHSEFFFDEYYITKYAAGSPTAAMVISDVFSEDGHVLISAVIREVLNHGGLLDILYLGVKLGIYPSLIFLGIGAMTDFSPLIANPKSLLLGAAAQFGVFAAFFFAVIFGFTPVEAAAIGIIGGADGPTAILVTKELAPHLLGAIAIAAYSYMALIPMIQPPFMRLLTTKRERTIKMTGLRPVSKTEKVIFPILVTFLVVLIVPDAAPLVGFLMMGNLFNVSGVTDRLSKTSQNELINIITIFLGVSVGATAKAENFLALDTILIIMLGLFAFCLSTIGGLLGGKIMCFLTKGKINPLIGAAGVSAVPMAARVAQDVGRKEDPSNFLLMHAMGPNVAGVIGSAVAAGVFLTWFA